MTDIREKAAYILGVDKLQMICIIFAKVLSLFLVINIKILQSSFVVRCEKGIQSRNIDPIHIYYAMKGAIKICVSNNEVKHIRVYYIKSIESNLMTTFEGKKLSSGNETST